VSGLPPGREILVVGGGPTGLTVACELWRRGVPCRVVDASPGPAPESRALGIHARTLELLDDLGVAESFLERGRRVHGANVYAEDKRIVHLSFDELESPYPFVLILAQSETERLLEAHLNQLGGRVERNVRLTQLSQDEDRVAVTLEHADGVQEEAFAGYVLGCDGAHSQVRKELGLDFPGAGYEETFALADVTIEGCGLPQDELYAFFSPEGVLVGFPFHEQDRWRLVMFVPDASENYEPGLEEFQTEFSLRTGLAGTLSEATWLAGFRIHHRQVPRYREGLCFVLGDAAHIHSPIGGQGMNTGMQDAYNLAWKLALVVRDEAPAAILDSYHSERHPIGAEVLATTHRATRAVLLRHPLGQAVRNRLASYLTSLEVVQRRMARTASQIAFNYRGSPIVGEVRPSVLSSNVVRDPDSEAPSVGDWFEFGAGPRPGERAPDMEWAPGERLHKRLHGIRHTLLLFDGAAATAAGYANLVEVAARAEERLGERIRVLVVVPDRTSNPTLDEAGLEVLVDVDGALHAIYGAGAECLYVIRPDGYVGFRSQPAGWEGLSAWIERVFL
jgi:2-polyprenyl-6-methoxyphenol hydroxylase-like FAD-dependent oxidoreductase